MKFIAVVLMFTPTLGLANMDALMESTLGEVRTHAEANRSDLGEEWQNALISVMGSGGIDMSLNKELLHVTFLWMHNQALIDETEFLPKETKNYLFQVGELQKFNNRLMETIVQNGERAIPDFEKKVLERAQIIEGHAVELKRALVADVVKE